MHPRKFFTEEIVRDIAVVTLESHISNYQGDAFLSQIQSLAEKLARDGVTSAVVDFSQVQFFGSSVLEGLRILWKQLGAGENRVRLCGLNEVCRDIIQLSHFDHVWPIYHDRAAALTAAGA